MALNTAIAFAILSVGILCARPDRGLMAVVSSTGAGGVMARRLLPAAILIPAVVGLGELARPAAGASRPGDGAVPVRPGQHRDLHGADLVERGVARPHGPRAAAGGAAPGRPVHGLAASWRSRPGSTTPCPRSCEAICESLGWAVGALWRVDPEAGVLRCGDLWHSPSSRSEEFVALSRRTTFAPGVGLPGRVWASGQPAWIPDVVPDANFPRAQAAAREGLHGAFGFPIVVGSDILGVVEVFSGEIQQPDEDLLQMLAAIGSQIGQFIKRKQAEEEVLRERYLLHSLMDTVPDSIYFKDIESRFLRINKALANRLGLGDPAEAVGKTDFDFFTEEHARPAREDEQAIIETGQPVVGKDEKETWGDEPRRVGLHDQDAVAGRGGPDRRHVRQSLGTSPRGSGPRRPCARGRSGSGP